MTRFERRLSVALHAYVDGVNLDQPAAAVVDEVLARPASRPRWRIPTGIAAGLLIVAGALAGIQALEGMAARPAQASVHGLTYAVAVVRSLDPDPAQLTAYGEVVSTESAYFADSTAYALDGVDPGEALVVRLRPGLGDDGGSWGEWMLLTRGGSPEGLCRYHDPQSPFVPDSCRLVEQ